MCGAVVGATVRVLLVGDLSGAALDVVVVGVNVIGTILLAATRHRWPTGTLEAQAIGTGFCGGLTTFSAAVVIGAIDDGGGTGEPIQVIFRLGVVAVGAIGSGAVARAIITREALT